MYVHTGAVLRWGTGGTIGPTAPNLGQHCLTNSKHRHVGAAFCGFQNTPKWVSGLRTPLRSSRRYHRTPSRLGGTSLPMTYPTRHLTLWFGGHWPQYYSLEPRSLPDEVLWARLPFVRNHWQCYRLWATARWSHDWTYSSPESSHVIISVQVTLQALHM